MILEGQQTFLTAFHETIIGLRTGQAGRANTYLDQFVELLSGQLPHMTPDAQRRATPVIKAVLGAKERDDTVALADYLQYALPSSLEEGDFSPTLLDVRIIEKLRALDAFIDEPTAIDQLTEALQRIYHDAPRASGLATYFAGRLYLNRRFADALTLIRLDEDADRLTPAERYISALALEKISEGNIGRAESMMERAYAMSPSLRDGFAQLAWSRAERCEWQMARRLMNEDLRRARLSAFRKTDFSFILGHLEEWQTAEQLILEAYAQEATIKDCLGRLGWIGYLKGRGAEYLETQIEADIRRDRCSFWGKVFAACHAAAVGDIAAASTKIEDAYKEFPGRHSWFCAIGWLRVRSGDAGTGCTLMDRDYATNRMLDFWMPSYAIALALDGQRDKAQSVLEASELESSRYTKHWIGYWHAPDGQMTMPELKARISEIRRLSELTTYGETAKMMTSSAN